VDDHRDVDIPDLQQSFRLFARSARDSPVYEAICLGAADEPEVLALMDEAPPRQRRPNLLLAAVHYLLLGGVDDPLATHYDTVAAWRADPHRPASPAAGPDPTDGPFDPAAVFDDFVGFCRRHRDDLVPLLATRATQTNEVGRCAALLPAFCTVAGAHGRALALVDLGASAGLNLLFDHYAYDYGAAGTAGDPASTVRLSCEVRAGELPTLGLPDIAFRTGLDEHPVAVTDQDGCLWLLACQWPGHLERFLRMRDALDLARRIPSPPEVHRGDFIDDLGSLVDRVPAGPHLCLYHSWAASYLSHERQHDLAEAVHALAVRRPLSWLFAESPSETPGLPHPAVPVGGDARYATALVLVDWDGGQPHARRLADMHPHGRWLRWWA